MGSETLVANEVLAFLQYQLDVMDEVSVTQICTSNFSEEDIRGAKTLLYESLHMADRMPSRRRDEKGERSLQDIINVLKVTDPDDVPTFVAKDLRKLPPVTFDHVDVTRLLKDITNVKASLADMQLKFDASKSTISELRSEIEVLRNTIAECRLHEASHDSLRHGVNNASQLIAELATNDSASATAASDAKLRLATEVIRSPNRGNTSSPRTYTAAVNQSPEKQQQLTTSKARVTHAPKPKSTPKLVSAPEQVPTPKPLTGNQRLADRDGFIKVERKKKKPSSRNQYGSGLSSSLLRHETPTTQLYVSRLHHSTRVEDVVEYIRSVTSCTLRVERLESRHNINFKSFVVRVPTHCLEKFMKEDFWPTGVVYRKFRGRLRDTTTLRNTLPTKR